MRIPVIYCYCSTANSRTHHTSERIFISDCNYTSGHNNGYENCHRNYLPNVAAPINSISSSIMPPNIVSTLGAQYLANTTSSTSVGSASTVRMFLGQLATVFNTALPLYTTPLATTSLAIQPSQFRTNITSLNNNFESMQRQKILELQRLEEERKI